MRSTPRKPEGLVLETDRLVLRRLAAEDAPFILELLNDPDWLRFIGDKGVRTLEDARRYIETGPIESYARHGFGLFLVARKPDEAPVGMCGLIKRDALPDVDVGYAFLPGHRGLGYARESAAAVLEFARSTVGLKRLVAITNPENERSIRVLESLGLAYEGMVRLSEDAAPVNLFGRSL
ncbi:MAG TPA: GNAT family N-acetyltransferase [Thermoanaerobaculia bacterium]|nr:GNAT family N-acetyltransferase [Thermoanaerobaculia bacterium]